MPCGYSNLLVNGQNLNHQWAGSERKWSGSGVSKISVLSLLNHRNHSLELASKSTCQHQFRPYDTHHEGSDVLEVTKVRIQSIDGRSVQSFSGFAVSFNQSSRSLIGVVPFLSRSETEDEPKETDSSTQHSTDGNQSTLDNEVEKLRDLEQRLEAAKEAFHQQKVHVKVLSNEAFLETEAKLSQCRNIKCAASVLFAKLRGQKKSAPGSMDSVSSTSRHQHRYQKSFRANQSSSSHVFESSSGQKQHDQCPQFRRLPDSDYTKSAFLAGVGTVLSFICLSCLAVSFHRRCCDPRARAERAARREERQTRKQYRRLARRHAWKSWWSNVLHRSDERANNYEEKRSLIINQESILETAMQQEIQQIRDSYEPRHGGIDSEEQGRVPSQTESLPEYRSRTSSGRPPSYHERDVCTRRDVHLRADGVSAASDATPDSSIANLSPRHSSETLRSERSVV